jgi:hypothetical protein
MKALSVRQPWAWAIIHGGKTVENRSWATSYRGPLLIHAAKGLRLAEYDRAAEAIERIVGAGRVPPMDALERGGIIGTAILANVWPVDIYERDNPWFEGRYGWMLTAAHAVPFVPWKGRLGLFDVPWPLKGVA